MHSRAVYRSRQVLHALRPRLDADGLRFARSLLNDPEASLFFAMEKRDQRHALEVAGRLRARGIDNRDLLAAALLHDCGKGAVPVWLRIANVLSPAFVRRAGAAGYARGWQGAAHRLANHVPLGARFAREAGASDTTVRLIAGAPLADESWMLDLLLAADNES